MDKTRGGIPMKFQPEIKLFPKGDDLNIISFVILLFSDIFVCVLLFHGLSQQIGQFTTEYEYFPYEYRNMLIQKNWVESNIHDNITDFVLWDTRLTDEISPQKNVLHPKPQEIEILFKEIENDNVLIKSFESYDRLLKNYNNLREKEKKSLNGEKLYSQIEDAKEKFNENSKIETLINTIFANQHDNYTDDIIKFRRAFAIKRTLFDFIFLLPVLVLFVYWNRKSFYRERFIQLTISSHYIIIAFLPILFESIRLIIEVIPKILLKNIFNFLLQLNLITFWYYGLLFFAVVIIVLLIWFLQAKVFTKAHHRIKQYEKNKCMACNTKIDYDHKNCPFCGIQLYTQCTNCGENTINHLPFCMNCGAKSSPPDNLL